MLYLKACYASFLAVRPCSFLGFYTDHMNIGIYIGTDRGHVSPQSLKVATHVDPCLLRKLYTTGVFPLMKQSSYSTDECLVSFCMCPGYCPTSVKSRLKLIFNEFTWKLFPQSRFPCMATSTLILKANQKVCICNACVKQRFPLSMYSEIPVLHSRNTYPTIAE